MYAFCSPQYPNVKTELMHLNLKIKSNIGYRGLEEGSKFNLKDHNGARIMA
jgi:hypothetical protein